MKKFIYNPEKRVAMVLHNGKLTIGYSGSRAATEFIRACGSGMQVVITNENVKISADIAQGFDHFVESIVIPSLPPVVQVVKVKTGFPPSGERKGGLL